MNWLKDVAAKLSPGQPIYVLLYAAAIAFFCFFYTALVFNSKETADNLKSGAFVPGIRPGEQTSRYIDKILMRLTLIGAIYITLVCLLPEFLILKWNMPFSWRHEPSDHCCSDHGFHGASASLRYVAPI